MNRFMIIVGFTILATVADAQQARVVVSNHPAKPVLQVKYYAPQLYFDDGVNIYRRQQGGDWIKLNTAPVKKGAVPPQQELQRDKELRAYVNMLDSASHDQLQGLVLLTVLVKSFTNESLSRYLGILYDDATAQKSIVYEYRISKITRNGDEEEGISNPILAGVYAPIDPPAEIQMKEGKKGEYKAIFAWKPETDRYFGVNVYRKVQGTAGERLMTKNPVMLSRVSDAQGKKGYSETMFEDDSLQAGRTYEYQLAAVDFFGRESRRSSSLRIEIKDTTFPPSPEKLLNDINHIQKQVTLTWKRVTVADLAGYHVYRGTRSEGPYQRVTAQLLTVDKTQYIEQVPRSRGYYYYVSAVDRAGNEANSDPTYAELKDVVPPSAPKNVLVRADTGKVVLSWARNTEPDVMGYQVYRTVNSNNKERFVLLDASPILGTSFEDQLGRHVRNKFLYRVVAIDSAHNKSEPSAVAITRLPDVTAPSAPFIKRVSADGNSLIVEWMPIMEQDVRNITLFRTVNDQASAIAVPNSKVVRYEDKNAEVGKQYEYFLTATDSAGNVSERSNGYTATLLKLATIGTISEVKTSYDSLKRSVTVSWPASQEAKGFIVYRRENGEEFRPHSGLVQATVFVDSAIAKGKSYSYRIKAFGDTGLKAESEASTIEIEK